MADLSKYSLKELESMYAAMPSEEQAAPTAAAQTQQTGQEDDGRMRNIALSLAHAIFGGKGDYAGTLKSGLTSPGLAKSMADMLQPGLANAGQGLAEFGGGVQEGFRGVPSDTDSLNRMAGQSVGKYGPAAAGAALAASGLRSSAGIVPAALAAGLGATGGESLRDTTANLNVVGGKKTSPMEGTRTSARMGLETAVADLGLGALFKTAESMYPTAAQLFMKIPAESIKRGIEKPSIVPPLFGPRAERAVIEEKGIKALRKVQTAMEMKREMLGDNVGNARLGLIVKTKDAPVVGVSPIANDMAELARQSSSSVKSIVDSIANKIEEKEHAKLLKSMFDRPGAKMSVRDAANLKKAVTDITDQSLGGMKEPISAVQERAAKLIGEGLDNSINRTASEHGYTKLSNANAVFSEFATKYKELMSLLKTPDKGVKAMLAKFESISNHFDKGGLATKSLIDLEKTTPGMTELLDSVAANRFAKLPQATPSGLPKDILRALQAPRIVGATIRGATKAAPAIRTGARIGGMAAGEAVYGQ